MNQYKYQCWQGTVNPEYFYGTLRADVDGESVAVLNFHGIGNARTNAPDVIISSIDDGVSVVRDMHGMNQIHFSRNDLVKGKRKDTLYYSISYYNESGMASRREVSK